MDDKEKARRDFWDEYKLNERPVMEAGAMCFGWMIGFDKGHDITGGKDAEVSVSNPDDGNTQFVPKSDEAMTGDIMAQEKNGYSHSDKCPGKSDGGGGLAELAFMMAAIALTISGVALVTLIVQSLAQAG